MDISSGDALAAPLPDLDDFELGPLDGLEYLDLDLHEFWDGGVESFASFLALPGNGKDSGLGLDDSVGDDGGRESSPHSVVTDDGAPPSGDGDNGGEMLAYVSDLERFLMEDNDGVYEYGDPAAPAEEELAADDYSIDDLLVADDDGYAEPAAGAGVEDAEPTGADDEYFFGDFFVADDDGYAEATEMDEERLASDEYFSNDFNVADDGYAGAGVNDEETKEVNEEKIAGDEYLFNDSSAADNGCADPAASPGDDQGDGDFAAREDDEATSRKRASISHLLRQRRCQEQSSF